MKILYLTEFPLSSARAGLQRMIGVAGALAHAGHTVDLAGPADTAMSVELSSGVRLHHVTSELRGRAARALTARGIGPWLRGYRGNVDLVIVYGGPGRLSDVASQWAETNGIPRVLDSVEWYEGASLPGGRLGPRSVDNLVSMHFRYPRYDGILAISRYLADHYRSKNVKNVLRVPPIIDTSASVFKPAPAPSEQIRLLYAGDPGRKDSLGVLVRAMKKFDQDGRRLRLDIFGPSESAVRKLPQMPSSVPANVHFHGRVARSAVSDALKLAHFVPIIRRKARYSEAGFPTKFVEAMTSGTPVLANHTSDLELYLHHLVNGCVSSSDAVDAVRHALEEAFDARAHYPQMAEYSRRVAENSLDLRGYIRPLDEFVSKVTRGIQ